MAETLKSFLLALTLLGAAGCGQLAANSPNELSRPNTCDAGNTKPVPASAATSGLQGATKAMGLDPQQMRSAVSLVAGLQSAIGLKRFVSLAPSNTELIYSLGLPAKLVAVSSQCDWPPDALTKEKAGSFNSVNLEKLMLLHPDEIFLVNGQEALAATLLKHNYQINVLKNTKVCDVANNIISIGKDMGAPQEANRLARHFSEHIKEIRALVATAPMRPKVFVCVWPNPLITVGSGSYIDDAITVCGGTSISSTLTAAYPTFGAERLLMAQPDMIILPAEAHTPGFLSHAPWTSLRAVRLHHVYFLPSRDSDRLSRPTLRLQNGLIWLAARIHPELSSKLQAIESAWQD